MMPRRPAIYGAAVVLMTALFAAPVAADHDYDPDYPDFCVLSSEELPETDEDGNPTEYSTGSFTCTGAIYYCEDGPLAGAPCKVCLEYNYRYAHRGGAPDNTEEYAGCVGPPNP